MSYIWIAIPLLCTGIIIDSVLAIDIDNDVGSIIRDLEYLYSKHVDISSIVQELNQAIKLWEQGEKDKALEILKNIKKEIQKLKSIANDIDLQYRIVKYIKIGIIISIPILIYFLLPRAYLYIWYRTRRKWIIREST